MRLAILIVVAATSRAVACPEPDLDDVESGGPTVDVIGEGLSKVTLRAVPSRPSLYYHHGEDDTRELPSFIDEDGNPLSFAAVYTGIAEYPLRLDFAITAGTIIDTKYRHVQFEVSPGMTPHTRSVSVTYWNSKYAIAIDSDAALLRYEHAGDSWFVGNWPPSFVRYFDSTNVKITAFYANGTAEVIFDHTVPQPEPPNRRTWIGELVALGLLSLLGALIWRSWRHAAA